MKKRNLFNELEHSLNEIKQHKQGKTTLRTFKVCPKPHLHVDATFIRKLREDLNLSRTVFALKLRVSPRTLEKWEQGKSEPNEQAAALMLMTKKFPDTLERLEQI